MFCTNCGKELGQEDKFCAYCGKPAPFIPLFKQEAKEEEKPRKPFLDLDWNLDGYPRDEKKKTRDNVEFNWGEFTGRKSYKPIEVEKIEKSTENEGIFILPELEKDSHDGFGSFSFLENEQVIEFTSEEIGSEGHEFGNEEMKLSSEDHELSSDEPELSIEELEAEIFGTTETIAAQAMNEIAARKADDKTIIFTKDDVEEKLDRQEERDKFYTFNKKQNEFLELLEKEKERLVDLGGEDIFEQIRKEKQAEIKKKEEERIASFKTENLELVGVSIPVSPLAVEIKEDAKAEPFLKPIEEDQEIWRKREKEESREIRQEKEEGQEIRKEKEESRENQQEGKEEPVGEDIESKQITTETNSREQLPKSVYEQPAKLSPEEKVRLRYSDIFPSDFMSGVGNDVIDNDKPKENKEIANQLNALYNAEDIDDNDEPKKKGGFGRFLIILLVILVVLEAGLLGIKFIAPDTAISKWTDEMIIKVVDLVTGNTKEETNLEEEQADFKTYMNAIVANEVLSTKTIGAMSYTEAFSYDMVTEPAFPQVRELQKFEDSEWFQDTVGNSYTYGVILARTLAKYYDAWQSVNQDESLITMNSIEIGEILQGEDGFYVLDKVTYASTDGTDVIEYQTVHVTTSDNSMVINEIKEEKLNG